MPVWLVAVVCIGAVATAAVVALCVVAVLAARSEHREDAGR